MIPSARNKRNIILSLIFSIFFTLIDFYFENAAIFSLILTYWLLFIKTKPKITPLIKTVSLILLFLLSTIGQGIASYLVIEVFKFNLSSYSYNTLFATILLTLINYSITISAIFVIKYLLNFKIVVATIYNKTVIKIILLSVIIMTISHLSLTLISKYEFNQLTYLKTTLLIDLVSAIFIITGSIMLIMGYMKELKSNYESKSLVERNLYIKELERSNTELRRFKHDYKNLLASLSVSIKSDSRDTDSIQTLLDYADSNIDLTSNIENTNLYHLKDDLIKGIIITKLAIAKDKNIEINFEIDQNVHIPKYLSVEITRILGILFDNAIEASLLVEHPKIEFALVSFDDYLEFIIKNNIKSTKKINLDQISKIGYTTKSGHNCLGLSTVNKIIHANTNLLLQTKIAKNYFSTILTVLQNK